MQAVKFKCCLVKLLLFAFCLKKNPNKQNQNEYFLSNTGTDALAVFTGSIVQWSYKNSTMVWQRWWLFCFLSVLYANVNSYTTLQSNADHVLIKLKNVTFKSSVVNYFYKLRDCLKKFGCLTSFLLTYIYILKLPTHLCVLQNKQKLLKESNQLISQVCGVGFFFSFSEDHE